MRLFENIFRIIPCVATLFCSCLNLNAQSLKQDSLRTFPGLTCSTNVVSAKHFILPAALITVGAVGISREFVISNTEIKEERDEHFNHFHTNIDNFLQFAPIVAGYAMMIDNKQHIFWSYTENVIVTEVILTSLVQSVKHITKVPRPDSGDPTSFPSGHTAQAFASATIFCDAFAQHKPWLQASVYAGASVVGAMRILNNRHWASDVIAGAGFGILSAKISELILQPRYLKHNHVCVNPL